DQDKANADPMDPALWPFDRRQLVDDLWAVDLTGLCEMRAHEAAAIDKVKLIGRDLQPGRAILAVAHWLQERHGIAGLFDRMSKLSVDYQKERSDLESNDPVRVAIVVLRKMVKAKGAGGIEFEFEPMELASAMNLVAKDEQLVEPEK